MAAAQLMLCYLPEHYADLLILAACLSDLPLCREIGCPEDKAMIQLHFYRLSYFSFPGANDRIRVTRQSRSRQRPKPNNMLLRILDESLDRSREDLFAQQSSSV